MSGITTFPGLLNRVSPNFYCIIGKRISNDSLYHPPNMEGQGNPPGVTLIPGQLEEIPSYLGIPALDRCGLPKTDSGPLFLVSSYL